MTGIVNIKIDKNVIVNRKDQELEEAIIAFIEVKKDIDLQNENLNFVKKVIFEKAKQISKEFEQTNMTLIAGDNSIRVGIRWDINISDEATIE